MTVTLPPVADSTGSATGAPATARRRASSGGSSCSCSPPSPTTSLGGRYTDDFDLPGTQSQQGADLLKAHEAAAGGQSGQIVFIAPNGATLQTKQNAGRVVGRAVARPAARARRVRSAVAADDLQGRADGLRDRPLRHQPRHARRPTTSHEIDHAVAPARSAGRAGRLRRPARPGRPSQARATRPPN